MTEILLAAAQGMAHVNSEGAPILEIRMALGLKTKRDHADVTIKDGESGCKFHEDGMRRLGRGGDLLGWWHTMWRRCQQTVGLARSETCKPRNEYCLDDGTIGRLCARAWSSYFWVNLPVAITVLRLPHRRGGKFRQIS